MITIGNKRKVGGDYFRLIKLRRSKLTIDNFKDLFNKEDYQIFKATGYQFLVDDYEDFKYAGYTFFKKDKYNKEHIDRWIEWMKFIGGIMYMNKPTPPFPPEKIIIKK